MRSRGLDAACITDIGGRAKVRACYWAEEVAVVVVAGSLSFAGGGVLDAALSLEASSAGGGSATLSWDCDIGAVPRSSVGSLSFAAVLDIAMSASAGPVDADELSGIPWGNATMGVPAAAGLRRTHIKFEI